MRRRSLSRYLSRSLDLLGHFRITCGETRYGFETLHCLLARLWVDGRFELLNPGWDALGYSKQTLAGRPVCELVALAPKAARAAMKSLLAEDGLLEFGLRCKDGREVRYRWHRQYDDFTTSMFIIGDEVPATRVLAVRPGGGTSASSASLNAA